MNAPARPIDHLTQGRIGWNVVTGYLDSAARATRTAKQHGWTRRKRLEMFDLGGRYPAIVGSASQVADELQAWIDEADVDGFNLSRTVVPESYEDFVDLVVPELQARGRYKAAYASGTLREKLFGDEPTLPERHAGAGFRRVTELA